jgi:deoxyhypusine synthase
MKKKDLLKEVIKQVDATTFNSTPIIDAMRDMSFSSRDTARMHLFLQAALVPEAV